MTRMAEVRKFLVALVGAAAEALSLGIVPDSVKPWVTVVLGFATAAGVYTVPNTPPTTTPTG